MDIRPVSKEHVGEQFLVAAEDQAVGAHTLQRPGESVEEPIRRGKSELKTEPWFNEKNLLLLLARVPILRLHGGY